MKGVILHGGSGTRLRPLTHTGPKQLIKIANKPMSQYALEDLVNAGITDIAIVLGDVHPERVREYYGDGSRFGCRITYIQQERPLGIAHAISLARDFVGDERFVVYLGDNVLEGGIADYARGFEEGGMDAVVLLAESDHPRDFGVAEFDGSGRLVGLVEKPKVPPSNYVLVGIYFLTPSIFDKIARLKPSWRGELEITDALRDLLRDGGRVGHAVVRGWWKDTGTPEDLLLANQRILDRMEMDFLDGRNVSGRVRLGKGAVIEEGARVVGPAVIGDGVVIGDGAFVGPYTSVADGAVIRGAEVENSIILDGAVLELRGARVVDSIIGAGSRVRAVGSVPRGIRLVLGENSGIEL